MFRYFFLGKHAKQDFEKNVQIFIHFKAKPCGNMFNELKNIYILGVFRLFSLSLEVLLAFQPPPTLQGI